MRTVWNSYYAIALHRLQQSSSLLDHLMDICLGLADLFNFFETKILVFLSFNCNFQNKGNIIKGNAQLNLLNLIKHRTTYCMDSIL